MNTYVKIDDPNIFVETKGKLDNPGLTYEDYLEGRPIKLEDYQIAYHKDFPAAEVKDVLNVADYKDGKVTWHFVVNTPTVESVREDKIRELKEYASSDAVCNFTVTSLGSSSQAWMTREELSDFKSLVESSRDLGLDEVQAVIGDNVYSISVGEAARIAASISLYINKCTVATKLHERAINELPSMGEVRAYDFTAGYPDKLVIEL